MNITQEFYDSLAKHYSKLFQDIQETMQEQAEMLDKIFFDKSINGVLYSNDMKTLIYCPKAKKGVFKIPKSVIFLTSTCALHIIVNEYIITTKINVEIKIFKIDLIFITTSPSLSQSFNIY